MHFDQLIIKTKSDLWIYDYEYIPCSKTKPKTPDRHILPTKVLNMKTLSCNDVYHQIHIFQAASQLATI